MHHAYLLVGDRESALSTIPLEFRSENQDILHKRYDRMSIADTHALIREMFLKPVIGTKRVFFISTHSILGEAQNALLKVFEDPHTHVTIYFNVPSESMLLPTLLSRFYKIDVEKKEVKSSEFEFFITSTYRDRLQWIVEKLKEDDQSWLQDFMRSAEVYVSQAKEKDKIRDVLTTDMYLLSAGSSKKMLLEHLALTL